VLKRFLDVEGRRTTDYRRRVRLGLIRPFEREKIDRNDLYVVFKRFLVIDQDGISFRFLGAFGQR
jgi:hypothetical protein